MGHRSKKDNEEKIEDMSFYLYRAYYGFLGLLERLLSETGLDECGVKPAMGPVLFTLYQGDDCTIKEIRSKAHLSPSTLTTTLNRMKRAGLVRLHKCKEDGRAVRVTLTRRGRSTEPRMHDLHNRIMAVLGTDVDDTELDHARDTLRRITHAMSREVNGNNNRETGAGTDKKRRG